MANNPRLYRFYRSPRNGRDSSRHPTPIVRPYLEKAAHEQKASVVSALCIAAKDKPAAYAPVFCIPGLPPEQEYYSGVEIGKARIRGSVRSN